ncbi:MAG: DASS family sodium-coupled anion symporter, partial [Duodenibacillus sp.]|nr:DASS family sodium-coupled anion symporter [Duodenibacillus sp.]
MDKNKILRWAVPLAIGFGIWLLPLPEGLKPEAWRMFAIFVAMIAGILCAPLPSGALMFVALAVAVFSKTITFGQALSGFASGTVWMIFSAYVLSLGFVKSGLGRRIAYKMLSIFGGSSLGVAYALGTADLILAPAMPSVTARSGGIVLPVAKSINTVFGSEPGPSQSKIGEFLTMTCFHFTPITGAMFMTGMAANPLCAELAAKGLGLQLSWVEWFVAAVVPAMLCFMLLPLVTYKFMNPELKKTPEAKQMGRDELAKMGPLSLQEKWVAVGFVLALAGWGTTMWTGLNANAIGIALAAFLFVTGAVAWKDVLADKAAWDTVIWFGAIISLVMMGGLIGVREGTIMIAALMGPAVGIVNKVVPDFERYVPTKGLWEIQEGGFCWEFWAFVQGAIAIARWKNRAATWARRWRSRAGSNCLPRGKDPPSCWRGLTTTMS